MSVRREKLTDTVAMNHDLLEPAALNKAASAIEAQYAQLAAPSDFVNLIDAIDDHLELVDDAAASFVSVQLKRHQQELLGVEYARTKLNYTKRQTLALADKFGAASELGGVLTIKVKALDDEITKVSEKLEFVEKVQLLKTTINKAAYAIDHVLYEQGAHCILVILNHVDSLIITSEYAEAVVPLTEIPELPNDVIEKWTNQLCAVFKQRFEAAAESRNVTELTKNFQMFPLIGCHDVGLTCYSQFISRIITDTLKTLLLVVDNSQAAERPGMYSQILINFFESISQMLSQHAALVKKYYGNAMPKVIAKIQGEIDAQIGTIADTFYDNCSIDKCLYDVKEYRYPLLSKRQEELKSAGEYSTIEPQMELIPLTTVGDLVTEFSTIFHHWSLYCRFVTTKYLDGDTEVLDKSNVTKKINTKLLPAYEVLYQYFFRRSLEKAITIEELTPLDPLLQVDPRNKLGDDTPIQQPGDLPVSSVIEDVTLVFNTTIRGCVNSALTSTGKKFILYVTQTLNSDYVNGFFIKNLNDNGPRYNQGLCLVEPEAPEASAAAISRLATPEPAMGFFRGASTALNSVYSSTAMAVNQATAAANPMHTVTANNVKVCNFITYLNSLAMAEEYLQKVVNNIIAELPKFYALAKEEEMMRLALKDDFMDPFTTTATKIIGDSLVNLYNQSIKLRLLTLVTEFLPEQAPDIEDENLNAVRYQQFSIAWYGLINPYSRVLHRKLIFDKLLRLLVVNLSNIIEKKLLNNLRKFKINDLGALKLERDMSHLINQVCRDNYYLRDKFVRVTQIVLLVGMDDDEYQESISHISQEGEFDEELGINWVLTPQERKELRQYRK